MTEFEIEDFYKKYIELFKEDDSLDSIFRISSGDYTTLGFGSLKKEYLDWSLIQKLDSIIQDKKEIFENNELTIHIIYLPFSIEPIHVQAKFSRKEIKDVKAFGIDFAVIVSSACVKELKSIVTEKFKEKAYSNGMTYRTYDHLFDGNWNETLKNEPNTVYFNTNNNQ